MVRSFSGVSSFGRAETFVLNKILTLAFYQPCSQDLSQARRKWAGRKALETRLGLSSQVMRRSNRNFNILPPGLTPNIWLFSVPGEWEVWFLRPSRGWGLTFAWVWWWKLNRKCQVSNDYLFSDAEVANSFKQVCGRDGRDIAFVSDWL